MEMSVDYGTETNYSYRVRSHKLYVSSAELAGVAAGRMRQAGLKMRRSGSLRRQIA